jgi:hypothetical protein
MDPSPVEAYEQTADRLEREVLRACAGAAGWRDGFEAALARLLRFVAEEPDRARALLLDVRARGGDAWAKHEEVVARLVDAVDSARDQAGARPTATRTTSAFVVGAIEEMLRIEIAAGRAAAVERLLPELTRLAFLTLFGEDDPAAGAAERRLS